MLWTRATDIIGAMWLAIFIIWAISGLTVKDTVRSQSDARARLLVWGVLLAWFMLFNPRLRPGLLGGRFVSMGPAAAYTGLALTTLGLGLALWARFAIGRNWGGAITVQEGHKVVRSGPYAMVRHPIYSGFMLATFGTAIAVGEIGGLVSTALVVLCWGYKARLEESFLIEQFGAEYEQYRHEVKGLIPGIW
jgi:protein-S-isoprenylcysteine O-methyltransferase Ste14